MKNKIKRNHKVKESMHFGEVMPALIFSTLLIIIIVFAAFFNYVCNLPTGCVYTEYFIGFFIISFILMIIMIFAERKKLISFFNKILRRNKLRIELPLDGCISSLKYIKSNINKVSLQQSEDEFCSVFKKLLSNIFGGIDNVSYEDLILKIDSLNIDSDLKKDLTKILNFLRINRYKGVPIKESQLKSFVDYSIKLADKFNVKKEAPKNKVMSTRVTSCDMDTLRRWTFSGVGVILILFFSIFILTSGYITGFTFMTQAADTVILHPVGNYIITEGHNVSLIVNASDTDETPLGFDKGDTDPNWMTISVIDATTTGGKNATANLTFSPPSSGAVDTYIVTVLTESADLDADVENIQVQVIENNAPTLDLLVPNMTWPEDVVNQSVVISDYFSDIEGDTLNYTYSGNSNINVSIDSGTSVVTLTPTDNWYGVEYITFTANDGIDTKDSNVVMMNVTSVYDSIFIESVSVSPSAPNNASNISCSANILSNDTLAELNTTVYWYFYDSGWQLNQTETNLECIVNEVCTASDTLNFTYTHIEDEWNCTFNVTDQTNYFFDSINFTIYYYIPVISNFSVNSDSYNRTILNESIAFNITWSDIDSSNATIYVCNSSLVNTSGCDDREFCHVNSTNVSNVACNYTVLSNDSITSTFWVFACDEYNCSSDNSSYFYVNQPPIMNSTLINLTSSEAVVLAVGNFSDSTYTNQKSLIKFNGAELYSIWDDIDINNATVVMNVTVLNSSWNESLTVSRVTNQSWLSSDNATYLTSLSLGSSGSFLNINSTDSNILDITTLILEDYALNNSNNSLLFYSPYTTGTTNVTRDSSTYFAVGDYNDTSSYGEMRFDNNTYVSVNMTKIFPDYSLIATIPQLGPDLDLYFIDPDGNDLEYDSTGNSNIAISIDETGFVTFTPDTGWSGTETINFVATDSAGETVTSNDIVLTVPDVVVEQPSSSSSSSSRTRQLSFKLHAGDIEMYPIDAQVVPVIVENNGDLDIGRIDLEALFPNDDTIEGILTEWFVSSLDVNQNYTVDVKLRTYKTEPGQYNVTINGDTIDPSKKTDSTTFTIFVKEPDYDYILAEIRFVKDLFQSNQECVELTSLLDEVENLYHTGQIELADEKLNEYLEECRDRISDNEGIFAPIFKNNFFSTNRLLIVIGLIILSVIYIVSLYLHRY